MPKNYYMVLGVRSGAGSEEIKAAFRRRARELHPDTSGFESGPFQEVQEAYGVLSVPERRRHYDEQFRPAPVRRRPWGPSPESMVGARSRAEPFRAVEAPGAFPEVSLPDSFEHYGPSFDELFDRLWSNFEAVSRPKAEKLESLTVEVVIGPEKAGQGGVARVWIPARATCSACGGRGAVGPYECWHCSGQGALAAEYPVDVQFPPGLRDGSAARIPLARFGIENFYLTVLFRVGRSWD